MKTRLIFFGTPPIAVEILKGIDLKQFEIVGVVTQTDKKVGRKQLLTPPPVKEFALANNIPVFQPQKVLSILDDLKDLKPDLILTCAYGKLLPLEILELVKNKAINVHASLLPKYRGSSPIQFALIEGEKETGISLMQMVQKMDAGDYYTQDKIAIADDDNFESLYAKLAELGQKMVNRDLKNIYDEKITPIAQNESDVTFAPKILSSMEKIDFNKTCQEVQNFIRALSPSPGAYAILNNERYKIYKTRLLTDKDVFAMTLSFKRNGEVVYLDKEGFVISTKLGMIKVLEIQKQGKSKVSAGVFFTNKSGEVKIGTIFNEDEAKFNF